MDLPMSSGDLLALRVFPRSDFGGYVSVWHRDPDGAWAQYVDRAPVQAGCPRAWGPALSRAAPASIDITWIERSSAVLDGVDLGGPVVLDDCPTIGGWPLPRRGVFAIGEAHGTIGDRDDYERLRRATLGTG